jgi:zeta-carotene isomerase
MVLRCASQGCKAVSHGPGIRCGSGLQSARSSVPFSGPMRYPYTMYRSNRLTRVNAEGPGEEDAAGAISLDTVTDMVLGNNVDQNAMDFGEDSAYFSLSKQSSISWALFVGLLSGVLGLLYIVWIDPSHGLGSSFTGLIESLAPTSEIAILEILFVFGVVHSGLAYLRPYGEELMGARAYRVMFALISLPLAIAAVVFFINHRYDGTALWNIRGLPGVHEAVWFLSFVSFYFLYPSTFNILEVAAVDEPKLHLWESGIIRITRHPQAFGQLIWCIAHTAWIGSSFMVATSVGLMIHHAFACWHGDFRLKRKYGEAFESVKERTSIVPFAAILDGRQKIPDDYWKEFVRLPYVFLAPFCVGAYLCHPLMQQASYWLGW